MKDPVNDLIATLRPDALTEDTYQHRRAADLARAFQSSPDQRHARHRSAHRMRRFSMPKPYLLIAATAVAGLAAAVIVIPGSLSGGTSPGRPPATRTPAAGDTGSRTLDARSFLLAAAQTAARQPAEKGEYWYTRTREFLPTWSYKSIDGIEYPDKQISALEKDLYVKADKQLRGEPDAIKALAEKYRQKIKTYRLEFEKRLPYSATIDASTEQWLGPTIRGASGIDPKVRFMSPADEAKWKALGSPDLGLPKAPSTFKEYEPYDDFGGLGVCENIRTCDKLPADKRGMEKWLQQEYKEVYKFSWWGIPLSKPEYIASMATNLMDSPVTPATRAAFLRVLADQPSIISLGKVTDPLGRTGVALALRYTRSDPTIGFGQEYEAHWIIDEKTTKMLATDGGSQLPPQLGHIPEANGDWRGWRIFEGSGWVDKPGEYPQG